MSALERQLWRWRWTHQLMVIRWSLSGIRRGHSPFIRCERCKRRAWAEEVIVGCGWCDRCWDVAWATDPALATAPVRPAADTGDEQA